MATPEATVDRVVAAPSWDRRVEEIRRVPEAHGRQEWRQVYAAIADRLYRPYLSPQFAYVEWREDYAADTFAEAYRWASQQTDGFRRVTTEDLTQAIREHPQTLLVFRTIIGYTSNELAYAVREVAERLDLPKVSGNRAKSIERGTVPTELQAKACAEAIVRLVEGRMWEEAPGDFQPKRQKPDTQEGWKSVRRFAEVGVPYEVFLHQRHYGGAFRTLLDATSSGRGNVLEEEVVDLLEEAEIPFIRTGSTNQSEVSRKFGLTVQPVPDFVVYKPPDTLQALIECKQTNDGGTARDKAARYTKLRGEAVRLGGAALIAVLDGLGWERVNDALGPVVQACDGRVFTLSTLSEMLEVQPLSGLAAGRP